MKKFKSKKQINKNDFIRFQDLAKVISHYLEDDGLSLTFQGYNDTVSHYFKLDDNNLPDAFLLMTQCNLWSNYLADVEGIIQAKTLDLITQIDGMEALEDKKKPDDNLESSIEYLTRVHKQFTLFYKQVANHRNFFERAYLHCFKVYSRGINTLRYKCLD